MNAHDRLMYEITGLRPEDREEPEYDKRREEADDRDQDLADGWMPPEIQNYE